MAMKGNRLQTRFGERVREVRKSRSLSQEELAELSGMHRTYISGIERGDRNVSLQNLASLAKALGLQLSQLLKDID